MLHELGFDVAKEPAEKDCDNFFLQELSWEDNSNISGLWDNM